MLDNNQTKPRVPHRWLRNRAVPRWAALTFLLLSVTGAPGGAADAAGTAVATLHDLTIVSTSGRHSFHVELAADDRSREQGLMGRTAMPADGGMLFDFGPRPAQVAMWMKDTFIPLDMLFILPDGAIACVAQRTVPQSLATVTCDRPVRAVLELNGGTAARLHLAPGDKVLTGIFGTQP